MSSQLHITEFTSVCDQLWNILLINGKTKTVSACDTHHLKLRLIYRLCIPACNQNFPALTKLNVNLSVHFTIRDLNKLSQSEAIQRRSTSSHWYSPHGFAWRHLGLFLDWLHTNERCWAPLQSSALHRVCVTQIMDWCAFNFKEAKWCRQAEEVKSWGENNIRARTCSGVSSFIVTFSLLLMYIYTLSLSEDHLSTRFKGNLK